jgi:ribonuclease HI
VEVICKKEMRTSPLFEETVTSGSPAEAQLWLDEERRTFVEDQGGVRRVDERWISNKEWERRHITPGMGSRFRKSVGDDKPSAAGHAAVRAAEAGPAAAQAASSPGADLRTPPPPKHMRVMQFNCNSVLSQQSDIRGLLRIYEPHVAFIQESRLPEDVALPRFTGYDAARLHAEKGRQGKADASGGLLALFREGLSWTPTRGPGAGAPAARAQVQDFTVFPHAEEKIRCVNLYVHPVEKRNVFEPKGLPKDACIFTDANAHHPDWDPTHYQCRDGGKGCPRGRALQEWAKKAGLVVLNDPAVATRVAAYKSGVSRTSPDVTLVTPRFKGAKWRKLECAGSDHSPLVIDLPLSQDPIRPRGNGRLRWAFKTADWERFTERSDELLGAVLETQASASAGQVNEAFSRAILRAAKECIRHNFGGERRKGELDKPWWGPQVEELVRLRKDARKSAERPGSSRAEVDRYHFLRNAARKAIKGAKRACWREFASELDLHTEPSKIFNTIKAMDGRRGTTRSMGMMYDGNTPITTNKGKAEALATRYASVCRLETTDRAASRLREEIERRLRTEEPSPATPVPPGLLDDFAAMRDPFTLHELRAQLGKLKSRKAAGADSIANELLTHLGPRGREALLRVANTSWERGEVPSAWRVAEIIGLLKKDKDPTAAKSYRPVQLTSCVAKLVERLVRRRLEYVVERWDLLRPEQAGFRACRSCEEQLALVSQTIADGFARRHWTVLLAVDFSAAFDRAWRARFLKKLLDKGFPPFFVRWARSFLANRTGRVRVEDVLSEAREFLEGFPQGTVLGPLFWDLFCDDLIEELKQKLPKAANIRVVVYADDVNVLLTGPDLEELYRQAQQVLDNLAAWELDNQALVSMEKSTVTVFNHYRSGPKGWSPPRLLFPDRSAAPGGRRAGRPKMCVIRYDPKPKLLGLVYDERLTFEPHISELRAKLKSRARVRDTLSGTSWGCSRETMRSVHLSYVQSKLEYALPAFAPFVASAKLDGLGTEQYWGACKVSGCPRGTRTEVACVEADLQPLPQRVDYTAAALHERCKRLPESNHARAIAERDEVAAAGHTSRPTWRSRARKVLQEADLYDSAREPLPLHPRVPPWRTRDVSKVDFRPHLALKVTKRDHPEVRRMAAVDTLELLPPCDVSAYTDGSVLDPRRLGKGGGGYVAEDPDGNRLDGKCAAGARCTSYRAEISAVVKLCDDLLRGHDDGGQMLCGLDEIGVRRCPEIRICLDCQSAIKALSRGPSEQRGGLEMRAWDRLLAVVRKYDAHITVQYVPGHVDLDEQEESDEVAKAAAAECDQDNAPLPLAVTTGVLRAQQRQQLRDAIPAGHLWHRCTVGKNPKHRGIPRPLQRALSQLRAGRSPLTHSALYRFGAKSVTLTVPASGHPGMTLNERGCVTTVAPKSAAARAKIGVGWLLEKVAGIEVYTGAEGTAALHDVAGQEAKLHLNSHGSPKCQGCGALCDDTEHLITQCPSYALARIDNFGSADPPLTVLQSDPWKVIAYLRQIHRLTAAQRKALEETDAKDGLAAVAEAPKEVCMIDKSRGYKTITKSAAIEARRRIAELEAAKSAPKAAPKPAPKAAAHAAPASSTPPPRRPPAAPTQDERERQRQAAAEATINRSSSDGEWPPPHDLPRFAYRALRMDEITANGLRPAAPAAKITPDAHVTGDTRRTQYVSLTVVPAVALYYARCTGAAFQRVVRIDLTRLRPRSLIDLRTHAAAGAAGLSPRAMCCTGGDGELLYAGTIPPEAISQPHPTMSRCEMLRVDWGDPAPRRPSVDAKRVCLARLPRATVLDLNNWEGAATQAAPAMAATHAASPPPAAAHAALPNAYPNEAAMVVAAAATPLGVPMTSATAAAKRATATATPTTTTSAPSSTATCPTSSLTATRASPAPPRTASPCVDSRDIDR